MYEALYRKWRPKTFDDVISQEHVTTTLKNQIIKDRTAHAYIFTGPRGTGKTTCARIFAKALNCLNPSGGNPCLKCEICKNADRLSDIIEIDAASNNGVDSIREIRDGLDYMPEKCRYRVYIIDEVHMLSQAAFNAFLKSIEEPPPHVKFIFATTEINKVPGTILSRCQRFDFHRVKQEDIAARIKYIISKENLSITDEAASMIASISDGGMRDALSLLDLCSAVSDNITEEVVSKASGVADRKYLYEMVSAISKKDISRALKTVNELYENSMDMSDLTVELCEAFRNIMLMKLNPPQKEAVSVSESELDSLLKSSENLTLKDALYCVDYFQKTIQQVKTSPNKRAEFEMRLIEYLCGSDDRGSRNAQTNGVTSNQNYGLIESLNQKIAFLEKKLRYLENNQSILNEGGETQTNFGKRLPPPPADTVDYKKLKTSDFAPLSSWSEILEKFREFKPDVVGALSGSQAFVNNNIMLIVTANPFFMRLFKEKGNAEKLREIVYDLLGKNFIIKAKCTAKGDKVKPADRVKEFLKNAKDSGIETAVDSTENK